MRTLKHKTLLNYKVKYNLDHHRHVLLQAAETLVDAEAQVALEVNAVEDMAAAAASEAMEAVEALEDVEALDWVVQVILIHKLLEAVTMEVVVVTMDVMEIYQTQDQIVAMHMDQEIINVIHVEMDFKRTSLIVLIDS